MKNLQLPCISILTHYRPLISSHLSFLCVCNDLLDLISLFSLLILSPPRKHENHPKNDWASPHEASDGICGNIGVALMCMKLQNLTNHFYWYKLLFLHKFLRIIDFPWNHHTNSKLQNSTSFNSFFFSFWQLKTFTLSMWSNLPKAMSLLSLSDIHVLSTSMILYVLLSIS